MASEKELVGGTMNRGKGVLVRSSAVMRQGGKSRQEAQSCRWVIPPAIAQSIGETPPWRNGELGETAKESTRSMHPMKENVAPFADDFMAIISSSSSSSFILIVFDNDRAVLSPFATLFQSPWLDSMTSNDNNVQFISRKKQKVRNMSVTRYKPDLDAER
jgi:hypothetical protein